MLLHVLTCLPPPRGGEWYWQAAGKPNYAFLHVLGNSYMFVHVFTILGQKKWSPGFGGIFEYAIESRDLMITSQESSVVSKSPE